MTRACQCGGIIRQHQLTGEREAWTCNACGRYGAIARERTDMSDSRFHLDVKFSVYGCDFEWKPSLNWSADPGQCDERITAWFTACYEKAYAEFQEHNAASETARRAEETERQERETLARLQAKYGA